MANSDYTINGVEDRDADAYVPIWAQTLIDLYTSNLKYEVLDEMKRNSW
jgi:hypothetical protein